MRLIFKSDLTSVSIELSTYSAISTGKHIRFQKIYLTMVKNDAKFAKDESR